MSAQADGSAILVAEDVTMRFGGLVAVDSVDLRSARRDHGSDRAQRCRQDDVLQLPDRPLRAHRGASVFDGEVLPPKPRKVVIAGVARTFQNIRLFGNMTALENVMVGRHCRTTTGPFTSIIRGPKFHRDEKATAERAQELLDFVGLGQHHRHLARHLPYGDQRRLEIARALATDPKLLLLDEPTAGMNPRRPGRPRS